MQMELSEKEKIVILNSDDLYHVMRRILLRGALPAWPHFLVRFDPKLRI